MKHNKETETWCVECKKCTTRASITVPYGLDKTAVKELFKKAGIDLPFICDKCKK